VATLCLAAFDFWWSGASRANRRSVCSLALCCCRLYWDVISKIHMGGVFGL
jgi:hypothetical protein